MLLKNKKTGEIGWLYCDHISSPKTITVFSEDRNLSANHWDYTSLAELNEEWEDAAEEPKEYWYIGNNGEVYDFSEYFIDSQIEDNYRKIGNLFGSKEEAEKTVEKLKAWKRLKDKGFRFSHIRSIDGVTMSHKDLNQYTVIAYAEVGCDKDDLDLLFGDEE